MKFVVLLEDDPKADPGIRPRHMGAHLDFLERNSAAIDAAGPLSDADGTPAGGIWVVEAANAEAVKALVHDDPFWPTGLRKSYRVLQWTQVFANGRRQVSPG